MRASSLIDVLQGMGFSVKLVGLDGRDVTGAGIDNDELKISIEGPVPVPERLLALLRAHRATVLRELRTPELWSATDWLHHFNERAAVLEHEAGLKRRDAEEEALQMCFQLWCGRRVA